MDIISAFHVFFVAPLIIYVTFQLINKRKVPNMLFMILMYLGILAFLYHLYIVFTNYQYGTPLGVNLFHMLIIAPLLYFIGARKGKIAPIFIWALLLGAIYAFYKHITYLMMKLNFLFFIIFPI